MVLSVRELLTKLVVRKGGGRPLLREATLKQQFEVMGKVSFDLGPEKYRGQNLYRDVEGNNVIYMKQMYKYSIIYLLQMNYNKDLTLAK